MELRHQRAGVSQWGKQSDLDSFACIGKARQTGSESSVGEDADASMGFHREGTDSLNQFSISQGFLFPAFLEEEADGILLLAGEHFQERRIALNNHTMFILNEPISPYR